MSDRVYITGLHGLKSPNRYDYSRSIAENTHNQIHFTIYNDENNPDTGWTNYDVILSNEELFTLLKDRCEVSIQEPIRRYV